jgi:hypothetical protein
MFCKLANFLKMASNFAWIFHLGFCLRNSLGLFRPFCGFCVVEDSDYIMHGAGGGKPGSMSNANSCDLNSLPSLITRRVTIDRISKQYASRMDNTRIYPSSLTNII